MPGLKWTGLGSLPGIPARDLTEDEARQHGERRLLASGLYVKKDELPAKGKEAKRDGRS